MKSLEEATENLYTVFANYSKANLHYCDCGCTDPDVVNSLLTTRLKELVDPLVYYNGSALYSIGELEHYKHFIPRILELTSGTTDRAISVFELEMKLSYVQWTKWPDDEQAAIREFLLADWYHSVNVSTGYYISETELAAYDVLLGLPTILAEWKVGQLETATNNFIDFFFLEGNRILTGKYKLNRRDTMGEFIQFIQRNNIKTVVENYFFRMADEHPAEAAEASAVVGILDTI